MKYYSKKFYSEKGKLGQKLLRERLGEEAYRKLKATRKNKKKDA